MGRRVRVAFLDLDLELFSERVEFVVCCAQNGGSWAVLQKVVVVDSYGRSKVKDVLRCALCVKNRVLG